MPDIVIIKAPAADFENVFTDTVLEAPKGLNIVYAVGPDLEGHPVAKATAWRLYERGLVSLVQRKHRVGHYEFIAQRTGSRARSR